MTLATRPANDPVSQAVLRSARHAGHVPVPLVATSYDIHISGGLADVVARRVFRNGESTSIEASLTFPLPVHAVLYGLEARIGDRVVKAVAKARAAARETYEDAVDRGKTAVLHEELLRGVHMLSVAHVAPGTEIEVTARFALALSWIGGRALLRIPTTIGDIYGCSRLPDCDELIHGGAAQSAAIKVTSDSGTAILLGGTLHDGSATIWLDAPINIEVRDWTERDLVGRAADGTGATLAIRPAPVSSNNLDCAILVDHSGSMGEPCAGSARLTKHAAVLLGLSEAADDIRESDRLNLWEFDTSVSDLGTAHASTWRSLLRSLSGPAGGTEIGGALAAILGQRPVRDILVITDGKSHSLDVHRLAASGVRFTVLLIGEDSLEANVGHLAAMSGGEIFVPEGADVTAAVRSALGSLRSPRVSEEGACHASAVHAARAGMSLRATWGEAVAPIDERGTGLARAVAAYAASLKLTRLGAAEAARLAESEGLVTHLTSLVLVDEAGVAQPGLPATRKIALPSPATYAPSAAHSVKMACAMPMSVDPSQMYALGSRSRAVMCEAKGQPLGGGRISRSASPRAERQDALERRLAAGSGQASHAGAVTGSASPGAGRGQPVRTHDGADGADTSHIKSLAHLLRRIDWRAEGQRLAEGNMIALATDIADAIDEAAGYGAVRRLAKRLGLAPRLLVIGLLARAEAGRDRHADRVARAILVKARTKDIAGLAERLGLDAGRVRV